MKKTKIVRFTVNFDDSDNIQVKVYRIYLNSVACYAEYNQVSRTAFVRFMRAFSRFA